MSSSEWREVVKLFDVLELQNGKKRPNSNGRFPVFGGNGVLCFCNRYNTDGENIIIGRVGAYCGNINLFRGKCWISDNAILCKVKKGFFSKFVYYALKNRKLNQQHIGSTQPLLTQGIINSIAIEYYDVNEQKAIAKILSALDEKIEINNKINKNLEKMAQAIFKRWFVDFEFPNEDGKPYKSSGGEMVQSELGLIPKGWEVKLLKDCIDVIDNRGKTPPNNNKRTRYPIIDVKALTGKGRIIDYKRCTKYVSRKTYETWFRSGHPKEGDILLSTVGSLAEMKMFLIDKGCVAQNVVALRCNNVSNMYMYQYLNHIRKELISYNIGSVQPSIKITHIVKHPVLFPKKTLVSHFNIHETMITEKVLELNSENQVLAQIRDALLPKLMSGEIRVPLDGKEESGEDTD